MQTTLADITSISKLDMFCRFKYTIDFEKYLHVINRKVFRVAMCRFRLSSHSLRIEQCRWERIKPPRCDRVCLICNSGQVEDEYHLCLICPVYTELRKRFIPTYFYDPPVPYKFRLLMESQNDYLLNQLSRFIYFAFQKRDKILQM